MNIMIKEYTINVKILKIFLMDLQHIKNIKILKSERGWNTKYLP